MNINGVKHWETLSLRFAADQRNINERQFKLIYTVVQLNLHNMDTKGNMDPTIYNTELSCTYTAREWLRTDVWLLWHPENCWFLERNWHLRHFTLTQLQSLHKRGKKGPLTLLVFMALSLLPLQQSVSQQFITHMNKILILYCTWNLYSTL